MPTTTDVLQAGAGSAAPHRPALPPRSVLVVGAGGALGSAVLERLLGSRRFSPVRVLVTRGLSTAVHGLEPVVLDLETAAPDVDATCRPLAEVAIVVFDRPRHVNGRELAFARPEPQQLLALATRLVGLGVQRLLVVLPHAPTGLPEALKTGLANLDEQAVAMLGFEQLLIVRSAQAPATVRAARWLQRVADGALAQLRFMVPASNLPVRAAKVAQLVVELAAQLPLRPPGTRIVPPELVWQAAQLKDPAELVGAWLDGRALPLPPGPAASAARRLPRR